MVPMASFACDSVKNGFHKKMTTYIFHFKKIRQIRDTSSNQLDNTLSLITINLITANFPRYCSAFVCKVIIDYSASC